MDNNSQCSKTKHKHQSNLLLPRKLQLLQQRHWNREDHDVCRNIQRSVREPEGKFVHALHGNTGVPEVRHRHTHECRSEDCPAAVDDKNTDHDITELDDFCRGEDPLVLEDDREFGEEQRQVVHWNRGP